MEKKLTSVTQKLKGQVVFLVKSLGHSMEGPSDYRDGKKTLITVVFV